MSGCSCTCATCSREHYVNGRPLDGYAGETNPTVRKRFVKIANGIRTDRDSQGGATEYRSSRAFAIDEDGGLWAWGFGPVGDGTILSRDCPTYIDHGPWAAVTDGFAIKADGTLWCIAGNHGIHGYSGTHGILGGNLTATIAGGVTVVIGDSRNNSGWAQRGLYCTPPTIRIDAPQSRQAIPKRQATAIAVLECHALAVLVTSGGSGYVSPPTVTVPQAPSVELEAEVAGGVVVAVRILDKGAFKMRGPGAAVPAVQFSGGGGSGASATLVPMGHLHDVEMTDHGDGYASWDAQGVQAVRDPNDYIINYYDYPPHAYVRLVKLPGRAYYPPGHSTWWTQWDNVATTGTLTNEPTTRLPVIDPWRGESGYRVIPESATAMVVVTGLISTHQPYGLVTRTGVTEPPDVEVYTPGRGSGASLRVETITTQTPGNTYFEHRVHIENRGSGYEFTPHIKVAYTKHNDVITSGNVVTQDSQQKTQYVMPHWYIDGHPTPMPTPAFSVGGQPAGSVVTAQSRVIEYGRMTPKRKKLEVSDLQMATEAHFTNTPYIYNLTGLVLTPTPMSQIHPDLAGKWVDVKGYAQGAYTINRPSWGRAINDRGEVWVWGQATKSIATPSVAPMPLGGEVTGGTAQDAGSYPPPARGTFAYANLNNAGQYGYLSSPGANATYHPAPAVERFDDTIEFMSDPTFAALQTNGEVVFYAGYGMWHRGHRTDEQYEWCTSAGNSNTYFAKRKNGSAVKITLPTTRNAQTPQRPLVVTLGTNSQLHQATSAKGMAARLADGSVVDFDENGVTTRYVAGTEARVTDAGSGYRQAAMVDEPTFPGAPTAVWPATLMGGVYGVDVEDPGQGYQSPPPVTFSGGNGSGAAAEAVIEGPVVRIEVTSGGSGYTQPPRVRFSRPGVFAEATAAIDRQGRVTGVSVQHGGRYRAPPVVYFDPVDGNGSGAAATAVIDGSIKFVRVTGVGEYQGGSAYTPQVAVHIPGAKANAIMLYDWSDAQTSGQGAWFDNQAAIVAATATWTPFAGAKATDNIFHSGPNIIPIGTLSYPFQSDAGRFMFFTKPVAWRRGEELLAAVTELSAVRQTYSHPMAARYGNDYADQRTYGFATGTRLVVSPTNNGSPAFFASTSVRVWHDGVVSLELTNEIGQGAIASAIRNSTGAITGWSWDTSQATNYLGLPYLTQFNTNDARVVLPPEGRPAAATAQVVSHGEGESSYYTVSGITVTDPGKFLTPPTVYLEAGGMRVKCVPAMVRGIQSIRLPAAVSFLSPSPRVGSTVVVGGGEIAPAAIGGNTAISGGAYTGKPRVYRGGRACRVDMERYATIHAISNTQPTARWPAPPTVVIESNEQPTVERWYAFPMGLPAGPLAVEHIGRYDLYFGNELGVMQAGYSLESRTTTGTSEGTTYSRPFVLRSASRGRIVGARIYNELGYYYLGGSNPRFRSSTSLVPTPPRTSVLFAPNRLPARVYQTHGWAANPGHITVTRPVWDDLLDDIILQRQ